MASRIAPSGTMVRMPSNKLWLRAQRTGSGRFDAWRGVATW